MKEVCLAFNLSKEICTKVRSIFERIWDMTCTHATFAFHQYVQFGNTFNLLHAAAAYISDHQKSVGVAGVSDKYGKRSWARYPALWTLKHVDSLPNPGTRPDDFRWGSLTDHADNLDPSDIAALDENPVAAKDAQVDKDLEAQRPENKRQTQEWAGIAQDPNSNLCVFVGRWPKQKGIFPHRYTICADLF